MTSDLKLKYDSYSWIVWLSNEYSVGPFNTVSEGEKRSCHNYSKKKSPKVAKKVVFGWFIAVFSITAGFHKNQLISVDARCNCASVA